MEFFRCALLLCSFFSLSAALPSNTSVTTAELLPRQDAGQRCWHAPGKRDLNQTDIVKRDDPFFEHCISLDADGHTYPYILVVYLDQREFFSPEGHPGPAALQFKVQSWDLTHSDPVAERNGIYCRMTLDCDAQKKAETLVPHKQGWVQYNKYQDIPCLKGMKLAVTAGNFCNSTATDATQFDGLIIQLETDLVQSREVLYECEIQGVNGWQSPAEENPIAAKCKFGMS